MTHEKKNVVEKENYPIVPIRAPSSACT